MGNTPEYIREYMRGYRENNPNYKERNKKMDSARGKALTRLAQMFPSEFEALFREEKRKVEIFS